MIAARARRCHVLPAVILFLLTLVPVSIPAAGAGGPPPTGDLPAALARQLKWRSVGPANMGGRVSAIAVDPAKPFTIYAGLGTGGIMKSTDNGTSWSGIFEKESVASIGAIAVAASDPNILWAGTGEANGRNSSSWGDGVYRSDDGGATWVNKGLHDSRSIARIAIDPRDARVVYVAAMGHLWGDNKERGVFRTVDGGATWTPSLQIDDKVGCIDLVIDPSDSRTLYAAMYRRLRRPWSFTSGGPDGGIYKTIDGGRTWRKLTSGLPRQTGRIGLDIHRANPKILYAVIESDLGGQSPIFDVTSRSGGVFRTDDAGETWNRVNDLAPRSFYFSQVRVDPVDNKRVYVLGFLVHVSDDGGRTFRDDGARLVHVDHHDLWIDPTNTDHLLLGNDGGLYASYSRARTWDFFNNMAIGEFYRVTVDMGRPYRIAGGLQDNQSWIGPSATREKDGITNAAWRDLGGGDGFYVALDPNDPDIVYAESQEAEAFRLNLRTGQRRPLRPEPKEGSEAFRFHWNAPLILSRHDPTVLYLAGNKVFRLTRRGERWEAISPDLTTQDPAKFRTVGSGAENHCTIYTLAESPITGKVLWAGTDDGKVWMTADADAASPRWTDLTASLTRAGGKIAGLWISRIEASHFDQGTAYVAVDGHTSDVFSPLAFMTRDFGVTWTSIAGDLPPGGPVKVIREDPTNRDLLFAGTEFGFFVSLDRGSRWRKLDNGLPTVAVDDIAIHPRDHDLVIGTHGRSIYVMDDILALEELTREVQAKEAHLFTIRPATEFQLLPEGAVWSKRIFKAENPPFGAFIDYWVRSWTGEEISLEVTDGAGRTVRRLTGPATPGINRVVWDLQPDKDPDQERPTLSGQPRLVPPGEYTVTLTGPGAGKNKQSRKVTIDAVPGLEPE
ncbi:MAG TPA: hypothetical protein VGK94_00130 [Candidatus Polarisedimenticolia bacterium]|jgi:photosystem II stability/assembly factor-like uncharacterized protein